MMTTAFAKKAAPYLIAVLIPCLTTSCVAPALMAAQSMAQGAIAKRGGGAAEQEKFRKDQNKTMIQGTGLGAILGAGAGYALGGSRGAIAGALIGGMLGNQFGQHVAMKKALAQTSEANLDACIKESLADNATARKRVGALQSQLADYKKRISAARAQGNTREVTKIKGELVKLEKQVGGEVASYDKGIGMQKQIVTKVGPSNTKYAKLNSTMRESTESRNALESQRKQIASLMNSL
jgi:hypothetical protein